MKKDELYEKAQDLRNNGKVEEAILAYQEVITTSSDDPKLQGYAWQMIGVCQNMAGEQDAAIESYQKAIETFEELKDTFDLGCTYRDMGTTTANKGDYELAIEYLEKSKEALSRTEDAVALGITLDKLGVVYGQRGDLKEAQKWITQGLATMRTQGDWFMEMTGMLDLAWVYTKEQRYEEAIPLLWAGIGLTYDKGHQEKQIRRFAQIYKLLAMSYEALGAKQLATVLNSKYEDYLSKLDEKAKSELKRYIE